MDFSSLIDSLINNWNMIIVSLLAVVASMDKVLMIVIKTMGNIRDTWRDTFPKTPKGK